MGAVGGRLHEEGAVPWVSHVVLESLDSARTWLGGALALDPRLPAARNWNVMFALYERGPDEALSLALRFSHDDPEEALS